MRLVGRPHSADLQNPLQSEEHPIACMRMPCDEAAIRTGDVAVPCGAKLRPWILAATILGSSMAFIDSTVVNVALPALQATFHATVLDGQWGVDSYVFFPISLLLSARSLATLFSH